MNAAEVFEQEWSLYRSGKSALGDATGFADYAIGGKRKKGDFDDGVKTGEYRIFADMPRPFVAIVVEDRGLAGWRIVPVSPFSVPASQREMLVGERVLQLWNACVASRRFVERSWIVDEVSPEDLKDVVSRLAQVAPGRISSGGGYVAEYERAFLAPGGSFERLLVESKEKRRPVAWWRHGWRIAAMLAVCLGVATLLLKDLSSKRHEDMSAFYSVDGRIVEPMPELEEDPALNMQIEPLVEPVALRDPPPDCIAPVAWNGEATDSKINEMAMIKSPVMMKSVFGSTRSTGKRGTFPRVEKAMSREGMPNDWNDSGWTDGVPGMPIGWTERYAAFRENEFMNPKDEPLSTFSLDVDTSSYAIMRSYLMENKRLPPRNSVRIEEYVNYFRYSYAQPTGDAPIAVGCELGECPWNKSHRLLRVGVQAKKVDADKLPPCNLTFLVDCSGSMGVNNGMGLLKSGLKMLVEKLRPEDHVSIVTYASGTSVLLRSTPGSEKGRILAAIDSLYASGCTYGSGGIQLAYEEASRNFDKKANNRVILVTDGDFNIGISSPKELEDFIASKRSSGIFLSVIGVGHGNYKDENMKKLANAGNGNYAYLDSMLEAKKVMVNEFGGTIFTVAKDVKVQIEFNPSRVSGYRLLGYENRILKAKDFNDDRKDAGEIGSGHTMTAFYELVPAGSEKGAGEGVNLLKYQKSVPVESAEMFTVKTRWKAPDGDKSVLKELACREEDIFRAEPGEDFRFASAVVEFALMLEGSKFKGDASFEDVLKRARGAKGADEEGYRAEFIRLVEMAELLKADLPKTGTPNGAQPNPWPEDNPVDVDL